MIVPQHSGISVFAPGHIYWDGSEILIQVLRAAGRNVDYLLLGPRAKTGRRKTIPLDELKRMHMREVDFQPAMLLCDAIEASKERLTTKQANFLLRFPLTPEPVGIKPPHASASTEDDTTVDKLIERGMLSVINNRQRSGRVVALTQLRGLPRTRRLRGEPVLMDMRGKSQKTNFSR